MAPCRAGFLANPGDRRVDLGAGRRLLQELAAVGALDVDRDVGLEARLHGEVGVLLGGLLGNLTDRLFRAPGFGVGHVVDFLQIPLLPAIFNLADVAIVSSMVLFLILTIRGVGLDGRRSHGDEEDDEIDGGAPATDVPQAADETPAADGTPAAQSVPEAHRAEKPESPQS